MRMEKRCILTNQIERKAKQYGNQMLHDKCSPICINTNQLELLFLQGRDHRIRWKR